MAWNFPIFVAIGGLLCPSIPVRNSDQPVGIVQKLRELGTVHSCHYLNPERFEGALRVRRSGPEYTKLKSSGGQGCPCSKPGS